MRQTNKFIEHLNEKITGANMKINVIGCEAAKSQQKINPQCHACRKKGKITRNIIIDF